MFFEKEDNLKIIENFIYNAERVDVGDEIIQKRLSNTITILQYILENPKIWDDTCSYNVKHVGHKFMGSLNALRETKNIDMDFKTYIDSIYALAYRFLCEMDFLIGHEKKLDIDLAAIKKNMQVDIENMDDINKSIMLYASYTMPANIVKEYINNPKIHSFKNFESEVKKAEKLKKEWNEEIERKERTVKSMKDKLDNYENAFNFVGLYQGFSELSKKKEKEANKLFISLIIMGILILLPLIFESAYSGYLIVTDKFVFDVNKFVIFIPIMAIEFILIYFFRIILVNHNSIKAQIIQIELRKTLCQFIQNYSEYSAVIKKADKTALEKFENLIFSGILSNPEKIPSTFDGIEQIGNFLKSLKK